MGDKEFPKEEILDSEVLATHPDASVVDLQQTTEAEWQWNVMETAWEPIRNRANARFELILHGTQGT